MEGRKHYLCFNALRYSIYSNTLHRTGKNVVSRFEKKSDDCTGKHCQLNTKFYIVDNKTYLQMLTNKKINKRPINK